MTDRVLTRLRRAYPLLPDEAPPAATVARLQALYADPTSTTADVPRRRWGRPSRRAGLFAIGAVIASGTAVAATTGRWHPQLGSPDHGDRPTAATVAVPAEQLALLAVLRRRQTDADRGRLVRMALQRLGRQQVNGIHVGAIRVIDQGPRSATILIPAQRSGPYEPQFKNISSRNVLCLETIAYVRAATITRRDGRKIRLGGGYGGGGTCGVTATLRTTGIRAGTGENQIMTEPASNERGPLTHYATLVPDGVAKVTVNLPHGRTITVPVRDNVYRLAIHGIAIQLGTVWYDATGQRIDHRARP
jgi:hypothetical protein